MFPVILLCSSVVAFTYGAWQLVKVLGQLERDCEQLRENEAALRRILGEHETELGSAGRLIVRLHERLDRAERHSVILPTNTTRQRGGVA